MNFNVLTQGNNPVITSFAVNYLDGKLGDQKAFKCILTCVVDGTSQDFTTVALRKHTALICAKYDAFNCLEHLFVHKQKKAEFNFLSLQTRMLRGDIEKIELVPVDGEIQTTISICGMKHAVSNLSAEKSLGLALQIARDAY